MQTFNQWDASKSLKMEMDQNEKNVILKAQAGNLKAYETLVSTYENRIMSLIFYLVKNREDAEDLYQDIFIKVFKNLDQFQFHSKFYTWLYKIAFNTIISFLRKNKYYTMQTIQSEKNQDIITKQLVSDSNANPEQKLLSAELNDKIQRQVNRLPLMQRTIFTMRFFHDLKIKEIAEICGYSQGTVKNTLFRSTQKMRKALSDYQAN